MPSANRKTTRSTPSSFLLKGLLNVCVLKVPVHAGHLPQDVHASHANEEGGGAGWGVWPPLAPTHDGSADFLMGWPKSFERAS